MFTWHDAEQERELLPCAIWPFSHRGWQTLKRNVSWLKEREPGNDTWNPPESCALNNLQTNMATDWFFNLHQEYLEKGREHIFIDIYIYTGMCVCLCVWKKTHSGGLDPSSFTLSLSYDPISQVSHSRTQHLQRTCCSWVPSPKNNSCVGIMTSPPWRDVRFCVHLVSL